MTTITIQSQEVQSALNELTRLAQNLQPAFDQIGEALKSNLAMCFREEKSPDGINWAALSPATKLAKAKRASSEFMTKNGKHTTAKFTRAYLNGKILQDTGRLKGSFTHVATNSFVEITTDTMYAPFHQFGTAKMPARPFFPTETLPQDWAADILEILDAHFQR